MRERMPLVRLREFCHTGCQPQKRVFMVAVLRKLESLDTGPHCVIIATNMLKLLFHMPICVLLLLQLLSLVLQLLFHWLKQKAKQVCVST